MGNFLNNYIVSSESMDDKISSMESIAKDSNVVMALYLDLESKSDIYDKKKANGTLSNEDIQGVKISMENVRLFLEGDDLKSSNENLTLSLEELEAEKKSMIDRMLKYITNQGAFFMSTFTDLKDMFTKLDMSPVQDLAELKQELKNGNRTFEKKTVTDPSILKDLAVYFSMYKDFNVSNFEKFINIPSELIDGGIVDFVIKHGYDNIIVSNDNAKDIPIDPVSTKVIDRIHVKSVREWLSKDTKFAMLDRLAGPKIGIISFYQDRKETDARQDRFTIPESTYVNSEVTINSKEDLIKLIDVCEKVTKTFALNIEELKRLRFDTLAKNTRSALASAGYDLLLGPFSIRRQLRQQNAAMTLANGILNADAKLVRSQLTLIKTVYNIIRATTSK